MGTDKTEHWLIAACGDGYLRVVNMSKLIMLKAIKGVSGNPICMDIAKNEGSGTSAGKGSETRDLIAVGFDDDSFVVYSMIQGFVPLYRGVGHRSYVSQIRFDNFYLAETNRVREQQKRIELDMERAKINEDWENALLRPKPKEKKMTIVQKVQHAKLLSLKKNEILPG